MVSRVKASVPTSKSDLELESRLKSLEEKVFSEKENTGNYGDRLARLEEKFDALISCLNQNSSVTANCPKNSEGKRRIQL